MFSIKNITAKNFLSIGNVTQSIKFDQDLTLILGSNKDLGGDAGNFRNGVGKTALLNALSYALYGQALTNIRKENLVNATNGKHMLVTVEFEKDHKKYRIERGRKPNVLKIFVDDQERKTEDNADDSQGDSRETQKYIEEIIGISHLMFKHLVALNTYTEPFLSLKAADQREVIENLLGITILSEKAENLKTEIRDSKDLIQKEQYRIDGIKVANENILKSISSLELKSKAWNVTKEKEIVELKNAIVNLTQVDINQEIINHENLKIWKENSNLLKELEQHKGNLSKNFIQIEKNIAKLRSQLVDVDSQSCPLCKQTLKIHQHTDLQEKINTELSELLVSYEQTTKFIEEVDQEIKKINIGNQPKTFYEELSEALSHKSTLLQLEKELNKITQEVNPFNEQIIELKESAIQEIDWTTINELNKLKEHQEFLLKLLTNKDSFIRKKIIDQNLGFLNKRLRTYTQNIGLPHHVLFQNDLSVLIQQFGQDLDFDNLSRGERNRLILSLSLAFRDLFESIFDQINILFVDELIDFGMDGAGVESGLNILKQIARERKKNIYLISHREELIGRVTNVLRVIKENGFTSYLTDGEI
jgi:DNA repair exonuclease SbcCD ATPase subunit